MEKRNKQIVKLFCRLLLLAMVILPLPIQANEIVENMGKVESYNGSTEDTIIETENDSNSATISDTETEMTQETEYLPTASFDEENNAFVEILGIEEVISEDEPLEKKTYYSSDVFPDDLVTNDVECNKFYYLT